MAMHGGTWIGDVEPRTGAPPLPVSIWLFAWLFVPAPVYALATRGLHPDPAWPLLILLGAAITTFFAHGVLRARLVRFSLVLALLVLALPVQLVGLLLEPGDVVLLVEAGIAVAQLVLLLAYTSSGWFRWHRQTPRAHQADAGASLALFPILMIAVVVGVMGGLVDPGAALSAFD